MNILHISSEVAPYSKTGGLGDVAGALPRALAAIGGRGGRGGRGAQDDRVVLVSPAYQVDPAAFGLARRLRKIAVRLGGYTHEVEVLEGRLPGGGGEVQAILIDHPVFRRDGLYGEPGGADYPDNAFRFALLTRAALAVPRAFGFVPDVVHAHDWQAGPSLLYARHGETAIPGARTVFTIHNLAFQGLFPIEVAGVLDIAGPQLGTEGAEFYGQLSFLKAGLANADRITTVSPRYAREIQTEAYGAGLDGYLRTRADRLLGILNGADYDLWNPLRDRHCAAPYGPAAASGKRVCKAALQQAMGLPARPKIPLLGAVSRLTDQKGFDLVCDALEKLLVERDLQVALLGSGDPALEARVTSLTHRFPNKFAARIDYDEALAHHIYAGADLFLMPSRYEPCGLSQLYALRYGAVPIVRATGGLDDTVVDYDPRSSSGTGFKFIAPTPAAFETAVRRALTAYSGDDFAALSRRGMLQDFSWGASARSYRTLYEAVTRTGTGTR